MADIRTSVRFTGDASQLLNTYRQIGAAGEALQRQINQVNNARFRSLGVSPAGYGGKSQVLGPIAKNIKTEVDSINNVLRTFATTAIRTQKYGDIITGSLETVHGNFRQLTVAAEQLDKALLNQSGARAAANAAGQGLRSQATAAIDNARALKTLEAAEKSQARAMAAQGVRFRDANGQFITLKQRLQEITNAYALYDRTGRRTSLSNFEQMIKAETAAARAALPELAALKTARQGVFGARGGVVAALNAAPDIPADLQQVSRISPKLYADLQRSGLGRGPDPTKSFAENVYAQGARVDINRDLVKGTTAIRGEFQNLTTGVMQHFNAELDKSGKLVTRFGGQLSGLQNFLTQTVRNFQKVVQWGIATTAVFGGLALATKQLQTVTDLDKNLRQLGVTANLTQEQTRGLFEGLADVAQRTATPLVELTKSADDIALAVRGSSKSTQEYERDILNLTEAVGIYTNLTGEDTVKATDILVSSMKQLGLQTEDVTGLLSKITAVAGGQSAAISDISQGLAVMAEAARQAGLSVDETIAAVQVLGQVTAKSPSEIATAFKNLVGALDSRAGAKALGKFNIELRDGTGQLRNILDIYKEISDKIRQGIIPASEVKGLVKAIAGGPRRAPDAAALLSAIDQIAQAEQRSIRASNEALIVNAKVLDTVQAKITQIQVAFDKFAFQTFGKGLADFVGVLSDGLTTLLNILAGVPSSFITAALQAGLFLAGLKLGISVIRTLVGQLNGLVLGLRETAAAYGTAAAAQATFNSSGLVGPNGQPLPASGAGGKPSRFGGIKNAILGSFGRNAALGFGVGAVAGVAGGGDIKSGISGGLAGAGLALLGLPEPTLLTKVAGGLALVGSAVVSVLGNEKDLARESENAAQKAEKILNAYNRYDEAADTVKNLEKSQEDLRKGIDEAVKANDKDASSLAVLHDLQRQYIDNTLEMTQANLALKDSFTELEGFDKEFADVAKRFQAGLITKDQLEPFIRKYQLEILRQTDKNAILPENVGIYTPKPAPIAPAFGSTKATIPGRTEFQATGGKGGVVIPVTLEAKEFDLASLRDRAEDVKAIFNKTGTEITASFANTGENFAIISQAIDELIAKGEPLGSVYKETFNQFVLGRDALTGATIAMDSFQQRIDAVKRFAPEAAGQLQKIFDAANDLIKISANAGDTETLFKTLTLLNSILSGKTSVNKSSVLPIIQGIAEAEGLLSDKTLTTADRQDVLNQITEKYGIVWDEVGTKVNGVLDAINEKVEENIKQLYQFNVDTRQGNAQKTADLQAQIQGGQFKGDAKGLKGAQDQIAQLNAITQQVAKLRNAYTETARAVGDDLDPIMQGFAKQLQTVNGLQDASTLNTEQLIERLFNLADTYGLTADQVVKLGIRMIEMMKIAKRVSEIKGEFSIKGNLDISQMLAALKVVRAVMITNVARDAGRHGNPGGVTADTSQVDARIKELEQFLKDQKQFDSYIKNLFKQSGGTSTFKPLGGTGGSRGTTGSSGPDVSTLDLPDEIANAANRDALIKEAIKKAKKLQSQIPGATAEGKNDIVELLKGTQRILEVRGVKDDLLRKALEELADIEKKRLEFETKADTIRRIRVGVGDFTAIANVPLNSRTGVSVGGQNQINVSLNVNGTILTPAQLQQFADLVGAAIKRQIAA